MRNVYLKFPELEDKDKWFEYIKEYRLDNPNARPLGCDENLNYEKWISKIKKNHKGVDLEENRVPSSVYFLMNDEEIVGSISIRHNINTPFLSLYGGHIGYGVRPSERRKGYATKMLHLALEKCDELGLEDIMISCKDTNIASARTIEKNGGILQDIIFVSEEDSNFKRYSINVKEGLNMLKSDD